MKLRELYPYWAGDSDEFIDTLELLDDDQWQARLGIEDGLSIRRLILELIDRERFWTAHVAQGRAYEPLPQGELKTGADIIDQYRATRAETVRYIESLTPESLRSVRVAPEDASMNEIERNVPLGWVIWHVVQQELTAYGRVQILRALLKAR